MIFLTAAILSFCSIIYELQLAALLASFLGNTIFRYILVVGLYLSALGIGAILANRWLKTVNESAWFLCKLEVILSLLGSSSILLLGLFYLHSSALVFLFLSYSVVILIGILSGFELPILLHLKIDKQPAILAMNYFGAVAGSLFFSLFAFPQLGLFATSFLVGAFNGLVVVILAWKLKSKFLIMAGLFIVIILLLAIFAATSWQDNFSAIFSAL